MPRHTTLKPSATSEGRSTRASAKQSEKVPRKKGWVVDGDEQVEETQPVKKTRATQKRAVVAEPSSETVKEAKAQKRACPDEGPTRETKKDRSKRRVQELEGQLEDLWEGLEAADAEIVAQEEAKAIRRLSDIATLRRFQRAEGSDESREFIDVDGVSASSEGEEDDDDDNDDGEEKMARLQAELDQLRKKKARKERVKRNILPLASGLRAGFLSRERLAINRGVEVHNRGLSDEDVEDERPDSSNLSCGDVKLVGVTTTHTRLADPVRKPKERLQAHGVKQHSVTPATHAQPRTTAKAPAGSVQRKSSSQPQQPESELSSLTASSTRMEHLPEFAPKNQKWSLAFLPTLHRRLYNSKDPFDDFLLASKTLVSIVQDIVDAVYIDVTYTVKCKGEPFHFMAYNRVNERRNAIVNEALALVIVKVKSFATPKEAKEWLVWARRMNGPLYWEMPTPATCKITDIEDERYIVPSGRLMSEYILTLASSALKYSSNALEEYKAEPPIGLFAIIMAALERAALIIDEYGDKKKNATAFSKTSWGAQVKHYVGNLEGIDRQKWAEVLAACVNLGGAGDGGEDSSDDEDMDRRVVDLDRRNMFAFQSPVKLPLRAAQPAGGNRYQQSQSPWSHGSPGRLVAIEPPTYPADQQLSGPSAATDFLCLNEIEAVLVWASQKHRPIAGAQGLGLLSALILTLRKSWQTWGRSYHSWLDPEELEASTSIENVPEIDISDTPRMSKPEPVPVRAGVSGSTINGGNVHAAGRDIKTTVNNIVVNLTDTRPLRDIAILSWLSLINYRMMQMSNLEKAIPRTCWWLLTSAFFEQWLTGQTSIIWGTGMPGAGKTIMASIVIDYLQQHAASQGPRVAVAFAFCRYTEPVSVQQILAALVRQLLERYPFLHPLVQPIYEQHHREMTKPPMAQLLQLLRDISQVFDTLYCVLDGLDEAERDTQFDLLRALSSFKAKFFITSRPLEPLHRVLPEAKFFKIEAKDEDIELLVREKLYQDPRFSTVVNTQGDPEQRSRIESQIKKAAGGMFLHAALQVETLRHATNLRHALDSLQRLPPNVNKLYAQTMERINAQPGEQPQLARRILSLLAHARPGLTVDDLRHALAIQLTHPMPANGDIVDPMALIDKTLLLSMCCGLVVSEKPSKFGHPVPRLIHFTAQDYLRQIISPAEGHLLLARTCLRRIISVETKPSTRWNPQAEPWSFQKYPLLEYAIDSWVEHGNECFDANGVMMDALLRDIACLFLRREFGPSGGTVNSQTRGTGQHRSWTPLMLAVQSEHPEAAMPALLTIPDIDVNLTTRRGTALTLATEEENLAALRVLLADPRVDVNKACKAASEALSWDAGPMNARINPGSARLSAYLMGGEAVQGAENEATALMLAARAGSEETMQLLLEHPDIDVNIAGPDGWTALMFAASSGFLAPVHTLLQHPRVIVDATNDQGETALAIARRKGHEEVAQLLVQAADADSLL
ncbi:hypothetical protein BKA70DRAFT_1222909 [Coprinopsis sp. MPI-PUGE-AT-0042]|nr:hypothetical protein BKA70DRAFT_1222909 [Coprinopsis sp. MPI-PUGE-AT-0042]